jgi:hypothetical protein
MSLEDENDAYTLVQLLLIRVDEVKTGLSKGNMTNAEGTFPVFDCCKADPDAALVQVRELATHMKRLGSLPNARNAAVLPMLQTLKTGMLLVRELA